MVRIAAPLGDRFPRDLLKDDKARLMRYLVFLFAMVIILFRRETSTVQSVQKASYKKRPYTYVPPTPQSEVSGVETVDRFGTDDNETLPDINDVLAEARREEMTIRFSNETWVLEWRAEQAQKRAMQKARNIDWSKVKCMDSDKNKPWESCDLSDDRFGVNVVFMSFGRSGSSITWETMSNLASERGQPAREDIGGSSESAYKELESINPKEHGKCWLERILCQHQYNNRVAMKEGRGKAEIIGTKWKPFLKSFNHTKSREALEWLAGNPHIKVIFNERNFLDGTLGERGNKRRSSSCIVFSLGRVRKTHFCFTFDSFILIAKPVSISRYKHLHTNAPAHCYGDQCIEYHKLQLANTTVPVRFVKDSIALLEKQADGITAILEELKVPHLKVVYEKLYYAKRADQWMDIFRFVGVGPMMGLEMEHVQAVSDLTVHCMNVLRLR
jgi:hypothetical protein